MKNSPTDLDEKLREAVHKTMGRSNADPQDVAEVQKVLENKSEEMRLLLMKRLQGKPAA